MKRTKYISSKNLPLPFPWTLTALAILFLQVFDPSQLVWGIVSTIVVVWWLVVIVSRATGEYVDLFKDDEE